MDCRVYFWPVARFRFRGRLGCRRFDGERHRLRNDLRERLDDPRETLPEEVLLHELGLTLEQLERTAEAREIYGRIVQEYPQSPFFARAQRQFEALEGSSAGL